MSVPVRPPVWSVSNLPPGRTDARLTAQKAFFQAARSGQTVAAVARTSGPSRARAAQAAGAVTADPAAADKPLRPGSIIDILI